MNEKLLERLRPITEEERRILEEQKEIQKDIYTATEEFTIDGRKMLEKGRVIDIRTHTRFVSFPKHSHNFIEILYMCEGHTLHKIDGMTEIELKAGELLFLNQMITATLFMQLSLHTDKLAKYDTDVYQDVFAPEILKYIEEAYQYATLEELAGEMNVALSTASKIVKKSTGMTFKELLQRKRLMQAANLMEHTNLPITEIIQRVGYDNTSYFHRIFRETYQMSPREYRNWKIRT